MIRKLKINDLNNVLLLNVKYKKEYHSEKQQWLFNNCLDYNCSYGIFFEDKLEEYIIAFKDDKLNNINIENFIWRKSKSYIDMMNELFYENDGFEFNMYICDKGLNIFLKLIDRYFSKKYNFIIIKNNKEKRYGEVLNHIYFTIKRID